MIEIQGIYKSLVGDPGRNRTCDLQLRRLLLYPLSYGARDEFLTSHSYPARSDYRVRSNAICRHNNTKGAPAARPGLPIKLRPRVQAIWAFCLGNIDGSSGSSRRAELVGHHRAPDMLMQVAGQRLGGTTTGGREGVADAAKIHV